VKNFLRNKKLSDKIVEDKIIPSYRYTGNVN